MKALDGRAPLLQQEEGLENIVDEKDPKQISVCAGMWNITGSIIGSSTLAMPYALSCSGWLVGSLLLLVMPCITAYSLLLLLKAAESAGKQYDSYEKLTLHLLGMKWFIITELLILTGALSLCMSMLIFIGKLVPPAFTLATATVNQFRFVCIIGALGIMLPLSLISSWRKLRVTSFIGTVSICYLVCFVIVASSYYTKPDNIDSDEQVTPSVNNLEIFTTMAMLVNSFCCHLQVLPIYHSLKNSSVSQGMKAVSSGLAFTTLTYSLVGLTAYMHFGQNVQQNILDSFWNSADERSWFLRVANISMAITLCFHLPLTVWPWRSALLTLLNILRRYGDSEATNYITSTSEWLVTTIFLVLLTLFTSLIIPSIKVTLSICGSSSGVVVFALPAMFYLKSIPEESGSLGPKLLMILGLFACAITFGYTISTIVYGNT